MKEMKMAMQKMKEAMKMAEMAMASYKADEMEDEMEDMGDGDKDESYADSGDGAKPMDEEKMMKKQMLIEKMKKYMKG